MSGSNRLLRDGEKLMTRLPHKTYGVARMPHARPNETAHGRPAANVRCIFKIDGKIFAKSATWIREGRLTAVDRRDPNAGTCLYRVLSVLTSSERVDQGRRH